MSFSRNIFFTVLIVSSVKFSEAQSLSVDLASATNVDFNFNTFQKLTNGIYIANAIALNIESVGAQWDLYMGSSTAAAGVWDNIQYYGTSGNASPNVNIVQVRVHNLSSTQQFTGFVPLQDIATSTLDIIGNHNAPDPPVNCSDANPTGTNTAGSYLANPNCYQFRVDLRIVPGLNYRPGLYSLQIDFIIAQDL